MTFFALLISTAHSETLTLPAGLKLVNENSRLIKITGHEEKISEADTLIARSRTLPEINAEWGYTSLADQPTVIFGPQTVPVSERYFLFYSLNVQQTLNSICSLILTLLYGRGLFLAWERVFFLSRLPP